MAVLLLAVVIELVMIGLSVCANRRFRNEARPPMQWSLSGAVNWTAPRIIALSFTPVLAIGMLIVFVVGSLTVPPRPGQEGAVLPALLTMGTCFVAAHVLHLWLIGKTLRSSGR